LLGHVAGRERASEQAARAGARASGLLGWAGPEGEKDRPGSVFGFVFFK
jgi:hypothetical protein